ncbi:PREDICTED: protein roadkill-like isoform X2 [Priapulus caudatus]|uniref:Protein roadkill-like isoform X2 n=1 Tax=Priapulus caudatus TaxID=37621 RepID=A0ABM1EMR8_PRICU|nr:PREDICTED: protein roadkill-like isoform X2 [Priapulus caudatus]
MDLEHMFDRQNFSDVTLCVGGREVQAHKAILSARSAVFAAKLYGMETCNKISRIDIGDMEHDVLIEIIIYIYTSKSPNLKKMPSKLLAAADKYALERLKIMCEEALCSNLNIDNVADVLILADQHRAVQLKGQCIDFIKSHVEFIGSHKWNQMIQSHFQLAMEVYCAVTSQQVRPIGQPIKVPECNLCTDLECMLQQKSFSDVTLCVGGRDVQAHKAILSDLISTHKWKEMVDAYPHDLLTVLCHRAPANRKRLKHYEFVYGTNLV